MHFKQDSVARKTNCFQEANIFVKPCGMRGGRWERGAPRPWLSIGPRTLLIRLREEGEAEDRGVRRFVDGGGGQVEEERDGVEFEG